MKAGEALLLWPGRHHFGTRPYSPNLSFFWIHFSVGAVPPDRQEVLRLPQHTHVLRPDHPASLFRRYLDDQESGVLGAVDAHLLLGLMLCRPGTGLHPDYLGRVFRQEYGETVTEAIHRTKLRFACRLLVEENETVDRVARRCGFPAVGHFRRIFKRHEGMIPLAYRRLYARTRINVRQVPVPGGCRVAPRKATSRGPGRRPGSAAARSIINT